QVSRDANDYGVFSGSMSGVVAYRTGAATVKTQLTWVDRSGRRLSTIGQPAYLRNPALSPDGSRAAIEVVDPVGRNQDIWIVDAARGTMSRFTFDPHNDVYPLWTTDGSRILFASDRESGIFNIYAKAASGNADEERLISAQDDVTPYGV